MKYQTHRSKQNLVEQLMDKLDAQQRELEVWKQRWSDGYDELIRYQTRLSLCQGDLEVAKQAAAGAALGSQEVKP